MLNGTVQNYNSAKKRWFTKDNITTQLNLADNSTTKMLKSWIK